MHIQLQRRARSSLYNNLKATERNLLLESIDDWYDWHAAAEPNEPGCDAFSKHTLKRYPRKKLILSSQESIGEGYGRVAFIQVTYVTCQMIRKRPWLYPRRCSGLPKIDRVEVSAAVVCLGRFGNSRQWQVFAKKATCNLPIPIKSKLALFRWRFIEDRENMWTYNILSTWKPFNLYWLAWILGNVQKPWVMAKYPPHSPLFCTCTGVNWMNRNSLYSATHLERPE